MKNRKKKQNKMEYENSFWKKITVPILCARIFDDGTFARCILFSYGSFPTFRIIALDQIEHNGGLDKFDVYGPGFGSYKYRKLYKDEIIDLIENLEVPQQVIDEYNKEFNMNIMTAINSQVKIVRKIKLERVSNI